MVGFLASLALAAVNITYPIPSLGNCQSALDCWSFCNLREHRAACISYGEAHGLPVRRGIIASRGAVLGVKISYPIPELGNCVSKEDCKAYCDLEVNRTACINYARSHGINTSVKASGGRAPVVRPPGVVFPVAELGNCTSVADCRAYCSKEENREACAAYARKMGVGRKDTADAGFKKRAAALGISFPIHELGNCASPAECRKFCDQKGNFEKCDAFAKAHGLVVEINGPGGCKSRKACKIFCDKPENRKVCMEWAKEHGMKVEGHGGPGGCMGDEECRRYCEEHPNDKECRKEQEDAGRYCEKHPEDKECALYRKYGPRQHPEQMEEQKQGGPGGCRSPEECRRYCEAHPRSDECREFWGGHEYRGPGMGDEGEGGGETAPREEGGSDAGGSGMSR